MMGSWSDPLASQTQPRQRLAMIADYHRRSLVCIAKSLPFALRVYVAQFSVFRIFFFFFSFSFALSAGLGFCC
jgi:hypothetical protein